MLRGRAIAARKRRTQPARRKPSRKGNRTRGTGRKVLKDGERLLIESIRRAKKAGIDDPVVDELLAFHLRVVRGDLGYSGRHIGERLRSAAQLLDRLVGRPTEQQEHTGDVHHHHHIVVERLGDADGDSDE